MCRTGCQRHSHTAVHHLMARLVAEAARAVSDRNASSAAADSGALPNRVAMSTSSTCQTMLAGQADMPQFALQDHVNGSCRHAVRAWTAASRAGAR